MKKIYLDLIMSINPNFSELKFDVNKKMHLHNAEHIFLELKPSSTLEYKYLSIIFNYNDPDLSFNMTTSHRSFYTPMKHTKLTTHSYNIIVDLMAIKSGGSFNLIFQPPLEKKKLIDLKDRINNYLPKS